MKSFLKSATPHVIVVAIFLALSYAYFTPLLQGKALPQHDIEQFRGSAQEVIEHREQYGEEPLWTNRMFSGMPAYLISTLYKGNLLNHINRIMLVGPRPASLIFVVMVGFYILLLSLGCSPWLSMVGAIAYGFSSFFFISIGAGHNGKMHAMSYVAPMLGGLILTFKGRYLAGFSVFALFMGLNINAGHVQITYYAGFIGLAMALAYFLDTIKAKSYSHYIRAVGVLLIAGILAFGANFSRLYFTYDYGKDTIRGPSELTSRDYNRTTGIDRDYATHWSYGRAETLNLLIPNLFGGSSSADLGTDSHTFQFLRDNGVSHGQARQIVQHLPAYWGKQPMTAGPVYIGAIVVFLFILGAFTIRGTLKWALLIVTGLSILLAWGHNLMPLTDWFFDYVPMYNKFRTVTMILFIAQLTMPLLGILALKQILEGSVDRKRLLHGFKWALGITGGICLFFLLLGGAVLSFESPMDIRYIQAGYPAQMFDALMLDRQSLMRTDAFRSLAFIALAATSIWLFVKGKLRSTYFIAALGLLILIDLWPVNKRYLNNNHFEPRARVENPFPITPANQRILADQTLYFRVFDTSRGAFSDASTSYYHSSIGGYHGAKLRRYQEVIDHHLNPPHDMRILNMLNTRYVIEPTEQAPVAKLNPGALGNAWFVDSVMVVENADQEIAALGSIDPSTTAVVDQRFASYLEGYSSQPHPKDSITLTGYRANRLEYSYTLAHPSLLVMSDIYYPKGWNAYVNDQPAEYFRANYILRAMILPAGANVLVFEFRPAIFRTGYYIDLTASLLVILVLLGWLGVSLAKGYTKN